MVQSERQALIIDTDSGVDDTLALAFLFLSPKVHIRAITLTHGCTTLEHIKRNAVTFLNVIKEHRRISGTSVPHSQLPVLAVGQAQALKSGTISAPEFHGEDGLGNIFLKEIYAAPVDWESQMLHKNGSDEDAFQTTERDAAGEILHQLKQADPLSISILAIAPLTNIALAYQRDPVTFSRVKHIVIMGGNADGPGNVTPLAEFNFYGDAEAADIVMGASKGFKPTLEGYNARMDLIQQNRQAPVHITVFPLEVGDDGVITLRDYEQYIAPIQTPLALFCSAFLKPTFDSMSTLYGIDFIQIYDAYTSTFLLDLLFRDGNFRAHWTCKYIDLRVETMGRYTMGMVCYDKRGWEQDAPNWSGVRNHVQVVTSGDPSRFKRVLLNQVFDAGL